VVFALQPDQPLAQELARALLGQLDSAIHHLAAQEADAAEAVHETRKALKRARTTLRLLRRALGKATFNKENACLRGAAQKLSSVRDAHMLAEVTKRLGKHVAGSPYAEAVEPVHQAFKDRAKQQAISEELLGEVVAIVQEARQRIENRLLDVSSWQLCGSLRRGIFRMTRRGRQAYTRAYTEPSDENFHEWRKRVKDLYYTACLLHLSRPTRLAPLVDSLDQLADDLGDERDLGLLATVIEQDPQAAGGAVPVALLRQLITRRREELRASLHPLGQALYRRSPRKMARFLTKGLVT
jgi:CHAD domain-containing protein